LRGALENMGDAIRVDVYLAAVTMFTGDSIERVSILLETLSDLRKKTALKREFGAGWKTHV